MRRILTFEEGKKKDIPGRGERISKGLSAEHSRLCRTETEYSLSARVGSASGSNGERWFEAGSQGLLVTLG